MRCFARGYLLELELDPSITNIRMAVQRVPPYISLADKLLFVMDAINRRKNGKNK